jgi:hypothetical protein
MLQGGFFCGIDLTPKFPRDRACKKAAAHANLAMDAPALQWHPCLG